MIRIKISHSWLMVMFTYLCACNNSTSTQIVENTSRDTASTISSEGSTRPVHWSYSEEGGPAGWARLSPVYAACGSGKSQSPVNLLSNSGTGPTAWKIDYKTTTLQIAHNEHEEELINNGHTIQVTPMAGSSISYGEKVYHLKQFHFHTPGEHAIDEKHFPMEIHLVHQADDKTLAVIGVLVKEGRHNSNFDELIKYLPNTVGEKKTHDSVNIDIGINVPKDLYVFHYVGSLTTPPCSEDVQWLVMKNPISMSKKQIVAFSSRLHHNNRPVQPMNGRALRVEHIVTRK